MDAAAKQQLKRLRTLGRGASGAVVWLASDEASGRLLAVKSAGPAAAEQLAREGRVLSGLRSPHIVPCLGSRAEASGEYLLFLEFAPRGSLADEAARNGGRLVERAIRTHAVDVVRGLAYLHGESLVHGDVKAANVMVGADGRAKLADFGCARRVDCERPIGSSPAFMAPEVARGEEQGTAADVWALACTVIEMATGAAPWRDVDDVFAAVHKIGYTDTVPEVPTCLSAEAKDFLRMCLARNPRDRPTAKQLLDHPFLASASCDAEQAKHDGASPKSTLNAAFWESDDEADEVSSESVAERIGSLASPCSALPDWDSEEGWIEVRSDCSQVSEAPAATVTAGADFGLRSEAMDAAEVGIHVVDVEGAIRYPTRNVGLPTCTVGVIDDFVECGRQSSVSIGSGVVSCSCAFHPGVSVELSCPCNGRRENNVDLAQILAVS